ncbi:MAG: hypothetical protein ABI158_06285 [Edaphobacter sp.]
MQILFAISILSFLVLLWAAVAFTRRIRATHQRESSSPQSQPDFSQYLFTAAEGADTPSSRPAHHQPVKNAEDASSWHASPATQTSANSHDEAISPKRD